MSGIRRAFSLIELLVVIAIIGILAAMLISGANILRERARQSAARQTIAQVTGACTAYALEECRRRLPEPELRSAGGMRGFCLAMTRPDGSEGALARLDARRLLTLRGGDLEDGILIDPWGRPYHYATERPHVRDPASGTLYRWWPGSPLAGGLLDADTIPGIATWNWDPDGTSTGTLAPSEDPAQLGLAGAARSKGRHPYMCSFGRRGPPVIWPLPAGAAGPDARSWIIAP